MAPPHNSSSKQLNASRRELSEATRWMIIGVRQCGVTVRHISEVFGVPKSTVHNTWTRFNSIGSVQPQREGRSRKTTDHDDRRSGMNAMVYSPSRLDGRALATLEWVFRSANERWLRECVKGVAKSGTVKKMIWGCFAGGLKGTCGGMRVDMGESVTAEIYIRTLDFYLLDFVQELRERGIDPILMQDNARVHTAGITKDWLLEKNVEILESWPPYSPDLNPIEHMISEAQRF
ncbi:uncharacterized protein H6S33_008188 [Morchella sextelata]|uniref:uncharacterized protein n=1 Tax=Morchella sextelata TaxID=1174677 RepID=UPI001D04575C|nr:uncharacterized protein H6S33_008188 [Morchella sextelata]KAH0603184.1 hypothetical protein H6S33_008188 [Morchella sextelata]